MTTLTNSTTLTRSQSRMLELTAREESHPNINYVHKVGIFEGTRKIIGGHNHPRSRLRGTNNCSMHAEVDAVNRLFPGKRKPCLL